MKTPFQLAALALLLSTLNSQLSTCLAQGPLTPPGAPAPTMKTLAQIEPRTALTNSSTAVTISQPGSYYLTTNLTVSSGNAITISANGVTLDLNGFTISSTAASATGFGILLNGGLRDITIHNGHIRGGVTNDGSGIYSGSGFLSGIYSSVVPGNVLVAGVSVSGCLSYGIYLGVGDSTVVEGCTVRTTGNYGIRASTIKTSSAIDCGGTAIFGDQVSDCRGESGGGFGVFASTAENSCGYSSTSDGVYASSAQCCRGYSASNTGVTATIALNCWGSSTNGYGISAETALNCIGSSSTSYGLYVSRTASGCSGFSNSSEGLHSAGTATSCYGYSISGSRALYARTAAFCTGYRPVGRAIEATVANGCYAIAGTNLTAYKYNMP